MPRVKRSANERKGVEWKLPLSQRQRVRRLTDSLPFADPTIFGTHHCNRSIEIVACTVVNVVFVVFHSKEILTIVAAVVLKLFEGLQVEMYGKFAWLEIHGIWQCVLKLTLIKEHTKHARRPRRSFGIESKAILSDYVIWLGFLWWISMKNKGKHLIERQSQREWILLLLLWQFDTIFRACWCVTMISLIRCFRFFDVI